MIDRMQIENNRDKGRIGLSMGINYFTCQGYTINLPLNDTQWYDFIAEKDGLFYTVQCKTTFAQNKELALRSMGGTKGKEYDNVLNHKKLDYLFALNKNLEMFLIPIKDLVTAGNKNAVRLHNKSEYNGQGFETYKYEVHYFD